MKRKGLLHCVNTMIINIMIFLRPFNLFFKILSVLIITKGNIEWDTFLIVPIISWWLWGTGGTSTPNYKPRIHVKFMLQLNQSNGQMNYHLNIYLKLRYHLICYSYKLHMLFHQLSLRIQHCVMSLFMSYLNQIHWITEN